MPPQTTRSNETGLARLTGIILPVTIVGAIVVFIVPLPPLVLDMLLSANITLAVLILLTVLSIKKPQDFSAFPSILVVSTLTRLVLNVAVTRLVLTKGGTQGLDAAGGVIHAFGAFVAGDQVVVGAILFLILVVIQFVVITKGATRISEVAARFMLDGLPGRQMAIDADLHAGLIDQYEAARRRDAIYRQADFFGAMDGAGKFVRGDAVAGVLITFVNIVGGLYLGIVEHGMAPGEAVSIFTTLTIGDGLVSQVPAFLISLAAGLIVTRSSSESDLGKDVVGQLFCRPAVLGVAAAFLALLAFTALPKVPMLTLAGALACGAFMLMNRGAETAAAIVEDEAAASSASPSPAPASHEPSDRMEDLLQVDPLELEIGYRLIGLAESTRGGDLLDRIRAVRQKVARELGLIVPQVRIRDEISLGPNDYSLKIRGTSVGRGTAYAGRLLAVPPAGMVTRPDGRDGVDPVSGDPAVWIHADGREVAELAGCRLMEASAVVAGHFGEVVLNHADELMTHEQVRRLLERARASSAALVDEVVPGMLRAGEVQRVLQNLVRERVSVRDLESILEALAEHAGKTRDTDALTEHVRRALGRQIVAAHLSDDGRLRVATLSASLESRLAEAGGQSDTRPADAFGSDAARSVVRAVAVAVHALIEADYPPVLLCSAEARPVLKDLTRAELPRLAVLSQREIPRDLPVESVGTVVEEFEEAYS
ncbi:MAG: flagellar biosynthesis pathway, component FlhA [Planctomycetota bacterium]|nr:flagellar biosynthesis pathway, component FlhA [Planctomycetota bacterium]